MDRGETLRGPQRLKSREARVEAGVAGGIDAVRVGSGDARLHQVSCTLLAASATAAFTRSATAGLFTHASALPGSQSGATWRYIGSPRRATTRARRALVSG